MKTKQEFVRILNAVKSSILDFYLNNKTISKLTKKCQPHRLDKVLSKCSKHGKSVGEVGCYYDEPIEY